MFMHCTHFLGAAAAAAALLAAPHEAFPLLGDQQQYERAPSSNQSPLMFSGNDAATENNYCNDDDVLATRTHTTRRGVFLSSFLAACTIRPSSSVGEELQVGENLSTTSLTVPLISTGRELLVYYRVDGSLFRAVLDTGSPYLMIPGSCGKIAKSKSGCYKGQGVPSGLSPTKEGFYGFSGDMEWRKAPFTFVNATGSPAIGPPLTTFGVASESIMKPYVFFGMIRDIDKNLRPSFLGQTSVQSFQIDLKSKPKRLTLSTIPMITNDSDYVPLTSDLRRRFGDRVGHYTACAQSIHANGIRVAADRKPIYVIFDTGVTGMVVSKELYVERYRAAIEKREKAVWGDVKVSFLTSQGRTVDLSASKPITTIIEPKRSWNKFRGHLIVLGLAFLCDNQLTIDIDEERCQWTSLSS